MADTVDEHDESLFIRPAGDASLVIRPAGGESLISSAHRLRKVSYDSTQQNHKPQYSDNDGIRRNSDSARTRTRDYIDSVSPILGHASRKDVWGR